MTKAPSLEMIRKEVKAALSKVSSSVELGQNNYSNSRQSLIKPQRIDSYDDYLATSDEVVCGEKEESSL